LAQPHLPFNGDRIGWALGLAGLTDEAVLDMHRERFLLSVHFPHLINHERTHPEASSATDALFLADLNFLAYDLFPLLF
jgi:hypothetical protein